MRLFTQHKSQRVGHRCLQVRLKGGWRPQGRQQHFQVAVDVIQRGSGGRGVCLDNHGVSQRKQMNKSADGERSNVYIPIPGNTYELSMDGWGSGRGRQKGREGIRRRHRTKFKMTAYIRMDF